MSITRVRSNGTRGIARVAATLAAVTMMSAGLVGGTGSASGGADWPMWGGTPERNMVSSREGLPFSWDITTGRNVKWVADLGSQTYGNPVVSGGVVVVGTNNELLRDPKQGGDRGVVMAFRESDGEFLWQVTHEKLSTGRVNDWPFQGVCASPLIVGEVVYYVSNRGEVMAVDLRGFRDGENDGPVKDEKLTSERDADVLWRFDMMEGVGSFPHNMSNSSPVAFGNLLIVGTSNGVDESHVHVPSPRAPSIIALDRTTGKLVWEDNSVGEKILHGQWASATVGRIGGVDQAIMGQGDGWIRGYEVSTGKKLWEFDSNPKDSVWPKTRNELISTAIVADGLVFIANGQDPEHGEGVGHLYAIDATPRGDSTDTGRVWHYDRIRRSISTGALKDGLLYYADFSGYLHCVDAKTGKPRWVHDMLAAVWSSPVVVGNKVYLGDEDGDLTVFEHGPVPKVVAEMNMGSAVYSSVVPANGALYVVSRNKLFALAEGAHRAK